MRLPGNIPDQSAQILRQSYLAKTVDLEQMVTESNHVPKTRAEKLRNQVHAYATASLVIDDFWQYLKGWPIEQGLAEMKKKYHSDSYDAQVEEFFLCSCALIHQVQNRYGEAARERHLAGKTSDTDNYFICFNAATLHRYPNLKGVHFPSSKDLVAMITRMAQVIPAVFERDAGRTPSHAEVVAVLRYPSMMDFFVQLMVNERRSSHPIIAKLEGCRRGNLNKASRRFVPNCFELHERGGIVSIRLRPKFVGECRERDAKVAARRERFGIAPPVSLKCPALYSATFKEMNEWVIALFEKWICE